MKLVDDMFKTYHKNFEDIKLHPVQFLDYALKNTEFRGRLLSLTREEEYEFLDAYKRAADVWKD